MAGAVFPEAPLPAAELDRALGPLGVSTMLPGEAYTSEVVLGWERRHLFAGTWSCLGRADELFTGADGEAVTQRAVVVGDVPVLLTRARAGGAAARAFANTCRHRGHELLPEGATGVRDLVPCPYHAWSYGLDGRLRRAPGFHGLPTFEPEAHGLTELAAVEWHGWVFVNATGGAAPFADHLGGMAALVAPYAPERLRLAARHSYDVRANWKVVVENYHECYHCPLIHPELCAVSPPTSGDNYDLPGAWVGGSMDLRGGACSTSASSRTCCSPCTRTT
jgi:Rieske 2Fe-2S family protein